MAIDAAVLPERPDRAEVRPRVRAAARTFNVADAFAPAGLLLFLAALAPPRVLGLPELERVLPALCPPIALLACLSLSERSGWRRVLAQLPVMLSFGLVFPWLATHLGKVYGFGGRPAATLAGLPAGLPLAWCAFLLLALALTERVAWHGLLPGWLRSRRPIVNGLILAALEAVWDPALLSRGLLWSAAPSWYAWPLRYTPGWPLAHFAIGNLWQDLFDTWEDLPPGALRRWGLALGLLVWPPLFFVLSSGLVPARPDWVPQLAAALADVAFASLGTATLVAAGSAAAARARRAVCRPRVLFTTATAPFAPHDGGEDILDYYASRFTRGQGPFVTESESIYLGSHLLARNLRSPSRVLDSPTLEELEAELRRHPYEFVAIGFKNIAKPKVKRMCRLVRRVSPGSRIVLGGYGVVCLDRDLSEDDSLEGLYDHACREEGVGFMRRLLGEDPLAPVDPTLPLQRVFPLGMRFMPQTMRPVVAGFGCARRCAFCATSAFFSGRHVRIAGAAEIALAVRRAFRERPDLAAVPIFDEDWMADLERAREVGRLLEDAPELPPGAAPLSVFATAAGLAGIEPEELVRMRIGYVWIGVESKFTALSKLRGFDVPKLFSDLYDHGVSVTGSFVVGLDTQTPENLEEDLQWFVDLEPTTAQVSLLGPIPGTQLWERARARNRLVEAPWEDQHLYHEGMLYEHLPPGRAHDAMVRCYDMLYRQKGPSVVRMWKVWLRAHLRMRGSADPALAARAGDLARLLMLARPAVVAAARLSPTRHARELAASALALHDREVARPGIFGQVLGAGATAWVAARSVRLSLLGKPLRQPVSRRFSYPQ